MMYLNFSALETALLPYFLFIVYGAILLWVRSVRADVETASDTAVIDSTEPEQTDFILSIPDPLADEFERELVNRVMIPQASKPVTRKRQPKSTSDLIAQEWASTEADPDDN